MTNALLGRHWISLDEIPSTNSFIKENLATLENGTLVTAQLQTAGRGRLGASWLADCGMLPFSFLIRDMANPIQLTLLSALAVCGALEEIFGQALYIKWTNDILAEKDNQFYKVCGILCESVMLGKQNAVICGIGINLTQTRQFFFDNDIPHGASLQWLTGKAFDREMIIKTILRRLEPMLDSDFSNIRDEYKSRCITLGKEIKLIQGKHEQIAFARGIDDSGQLICENAQGVFTVNSGETKIRGMLDYAE